jgi:tRNA 2-thiouridine synthesizing protein E
MDTTQLESGLDLLPNGRLSDISQWTPEVATSIAEHEGMTLKPEHWTIIDLMRDFYSRYNISPVDRLLKKHIKRRLGAEFANDDYLNSLFPNNALIQGTRISGLPIPLLDSELYTPEHNPPAAHQDAGKIVDDESSYYFTHDFSFEGRSIKVHPSGNLVDPSEWNESMAIFLAQKESIDLIDEHWKIIRYLRDYYFKYGITPMVNLLIDYLKEISQDRMVNIDHLYTLFPEGPARQGSRIAGLPLPQGCID